MNLFINKSGLIYLNYSNTGFVIAGIALRSMNFNVGTYLIIISHEYSVIASHLVNSKCSKAWLVVHNLIKGWSLIFIKPFNFNILSFYKPMTYVPPSTLISPLDNSDIPSSPICLFPVISSSSN